MDEFISGTEILNSVSVKPVEKQELHTRSSHFIGFSDSCQSCQLSVKCFGFCSSSSTAQFHIMYRTEPLIILFIHAEYKAGVFLWAQGCEEADQAGSPVCFPLISVKIFPLEKPEGHSPLERCAQFIFLTSLLPTHWSFAMVLVEAADSGKRSSHE